MTRIFVESSSTFLIFFDDDAYAFTSACRNFFHDDARDSTSTTSRRFFPRRRTLPSALSLPCPKFHVAESAERVVSVVCGFRRTATFSSIAALLDDRNTRRVWFHFSRIH